MNPNPAPRLLTDEELARLDALLEAANPDGSMTLEELDGFFAALACSPERVPAEEYLSVALGAEPDQPGAAATSRLSEADGQTLRKLLESHRQAVSGQLHSGEGYAPVMGQDENGRAQGNAWAIGFVRGMALRPDGWDELDEDEEFSDALDPLMRLVEEVEPDEDDEPLPISDEERGPLIEAMFEGVMDAYERLRATRERNLAPPPLRRASKVGRNDPCPCGSGKKYKQCCGADPVVH